MQMKNRDVSIFVITRFGIGQSSSTFYDKEFPYIENLLKNSILKQSHDITKWIVLIDINTPAYIYEKLRKIASKEILYIYSHDPFSEGSMMADIPAILKKFEIKKKDKILTIRVDADDMLSNNYVEMIMDSIYTDNLIEKYHQISISASRGVYFYPSQSKFIQVLKSDYSVQALYSIFGNNFHSVYDYSHKTIGRDTVNNGGYSCILRSEALWIRTIRRFSSQRFGKKFGIFDAKFDVLKTYIKIFLGKWIDNNTLYKERVNTLDLSESFEISEKLTLSLVDLEKKFEADEVILPPLVKGLINSGVGPTRMKLKQALLDLHQLEANEEYKNKIKIEFYEI
jgi:hypothetical protein